jgi:hypothetical protein
MKIKVIYQRNYGVEMFYPADEWTSKFLTIFRSPSARAKCMSRRQIEGLRELGFEVEFIADAI